MDIAIVGAGPAGSYAAYLLSRAGHKVRVYEKHKQIGIPVQCTGILSDYFNKIQLPKEDYILNTVERARIHAPGKDYVEAKIKRNYVICRKRFDSYLARLAEGSGSKYLLGHSFKSLVPGRRITASFNVEGKEKKIDCDALVGADGPLSPVAKAAGLFGEREFFIGTQIEAKKRNDNVVEFYPHIGCYAWIVPVNRKIVRIGVTSRKGKAEYEGFVNEHIIDIDKNTIENQSGVIPLFNNSQRMHKGNVFLIGDAATMVKATSGGGINQGLRAAETLAEALAKNKDFTKLWRKRHLWKLKVHRMAHLMMRRFSDADWNYLIREFKRPGLAKLLYNESRDEILPMMLKIALASPGLPIRFARYFPLKELSQ